MRECPNCGALWSPNRERCQGCGTWLITCAPIEVVRASDARPRDPDTSKLAGLRQQPRSGSQRALILEALRSHGPMTAREIEAATGIRGAWKRVSELKAGEHIHAAGTIHDDDSNTDVTVYRAGRAPVPDAVLF